MKNITSLKLALTLAMLSLFAVAAPLGANAASEDAVRAFVTKGSWRAPIGAAISTFTFNADGSYDEIYCAKAKKGKWTLKGSTITMNAPEGATFTLTAEPAEKILKRGKNTYKPAPKSVSAKEARAFVMKGSWTAKYGQNTSTFTFLASDVYVEEWKGKEKQGTWKMGAGNELILSTPENSKIYLSLDVPANALCRNKNIYKPASK